MSTKSNTQSKESTSTDQVTKDLVAKVSLNTTASGKIRALLSHFRAAGSEKPRAATLKFLNDYFPKANGKAWIYQHVRGVDVTPLSTKS